MKEEEENKEKIDLIIEDNNNTSNKNKDIIPSKEISQFISIVNQITKSLPETLNTVQKDFSYLEAKLFNIMDKLNNSININNNFNNIIDITHDANKHNNILKDDISYDIKHDNKLNKYIEIFDNYQRYLLDKNNELVNNIKESIIKEIRKKLDTFKLEKNNIFYKFQRIINDVQKLKKNIDLIENKDNEEFKIDNNSNDLEILQKYFKDFEKDFNQVLLNMKKLNENMILFISENLSKYFETQVKITEEINKERNRLINIIQKEKESEDTFYYEKIKKMNEILSNDIKKFILIKSEYKAESKDKKKTLLSRIGDALFAETECYIMYSNIENDMGLYNINKNEDDDIYNKEDLTSLKILINKLKKSEVVSDDSLNNGFIILGNNSDKKRYINLCLNFVKYVNSSNKENKIDYFKYKNFDNFIFANNLLNMISHNCKNNISYKDKNEDFKENYKYYEILDNIINIGDKSFIENKFMSSLLKDSQFINNIKILKSCFKCQLITLIKNYLNKNDKSTNNIQNIINLFRNKTGVSSYQNFDFITNLQIDKYLENYNKLNTNEKNNFNNYDLPKIVHETMKKYVFYMANYNVPYIDVLNFIKEINEDFPFIKDEYWSFYLDYYKASLYSIKKQMAIPESKITDIKTKKKIKYIKNLNPKENDNDNIINREYNIKQEKKIIIILKNSISFLNNNDKRNLLCLNKGIKMSKYIYKNLLKEKNLSLEKHIKIWKIILKCSKIKSLNYTELCKNNEKIEYYKVILDDTKRTALKAKNKDESKDIIKNILCCSVKANKSKIKYCQGMNFLAAFLYDITSNEEESFLLLTSLIDNTLLAKIYDHKFELLNSYFYILDRLIFLFLPKISQKFKEVQVNIDCFASSYFLTLFSNVYIISFSAEKIIIFIIDDFINKGWKVVFKAILAILKFNEKEIMEKNNDEVVNYIVHDLKKSEIFLEENFDKFVNYYKNINFKDDLIDNLQEEYNLEKKIITELNINIDE